MRFNFRKVSSVLGSAVMLGSTFALAAAANYPAPFVSGGSADVAVVYGSSAAQTDYAAATNIGSDLSATLASQSVSVGGAVTTEGETTPLFGSTRLYINDSLNSVKSVLTDTQLPTVLADETFSGNVDAKGTFKIDIGGNPSVTFAKMPTSSDDPRFGVTVGTNANTQPIYNASVNFNKAVNFTHSESEGQDITLFGQRFTIAADTDTTKLVLLKSAARINLDSDNPSQDVTVGGNTYTVTLVSASDTAATVRVTDANGNSDQREINEAASKKVQGLTVAVTTADETNLKLSASVVAGAEKVTLQTGTSVTFGEDDTVVDGTNVLFPSGTYTGNITSIVVSVAAANSDEDAITPGSYLVDPVFGSFKVDFAGLSIPDASDEREDISIKNSGDDKMEITFTDHGGNEKSFRWATNLTRALELQVDDSGNNITVLEQQALYRNGYLVVGNEDEGHLLKLSSVVNQSGTSYSSDKVSFSDVFSGTTYDTSITAKGTGTVSIGGKDFGVSYTGASTNQDTIAVRLNHPDSTGNNLVVFPSIETSKGAKLAFTQPTAVVLNNYNGAGAWLANASGLMVPDGDGFTTITITPTLEAPTNHTWNVTFGATTTNINTTDTAASATGSIGRLTYNVSAFGTAEQLKISVQKIGGGVSLDPAVVILEEQDDDNDYEALLVTLEPGATSDDGVGTNDVERTWDSDNTAWELTLASNSDTTKEADLWGTIITTDSSDSDQKSATISYPDDQIYAQVYISALDASVSAGGSTTIVPVKDSEVSGVSTKNLLVIGGSCVNTVAASLLGSSSTLCGPEFTSKTQIGSGEYLIQTFQSPYSDSKIATLVAGYEAADTTNAINSLKTNKPDTSVGKKFKGTTASSLVAA